MYKCIIYDVYLYTQDLIYDYYTHDNIWYDNQSLSLACIQSSICKPKKSNSKTNKTFDFSLKEESKCAKKNALSVHFINHWSYS